MPAPMPSAVRLLLAAVALLLAGCGSPADPSGPLQARDDASVPAAPEVSVHEGTLRIDRDVSVGGCTGAGVNPHDQSYERGVLELWLDGNATALSLALEWTPVNPTAERLNFSLYGGEPAPGVRPVAWRVGTSPFAWDLDGAALAAFRHDVRLVPSGDPCEAPGVYAAAIVGQELAYRVTVAG